MPGLTPYQTYSGDKIRLFCETCNNDRCLSLHDEDHGWIICNQCDNLVYHIAYDHEDEMYICIDCQNEEKSE